MTDYVLRTLKGPPAYEGPILVKDLIERASVCHYYQSPAWIGCFSGDTDEWLLTARDGMVVAASYARAVKYPFSRRIKYVIAAGPIYVDHAALGEHLNQVVAHLAARAIEIVIHPATMATTPGELEQICRAAGFSQTGDEGLPYTHTLSIDLRRPLDAIEADFRASLMRQIGKAGSLGLHAAGVSRENLGPLLDRVGRFYRHRGIGFPTKRRLLCFLERHGNDPKNCLVLGAWMKGKLVGAVIMIGCGRRLVYAYGYRAEDGEMRGIPATHLLHYQAIRWAQRNGYEVYDFGGYDMERRDSGTNQFKLGFSRNIEHLYGSYRYVASPVRAGALRRIGRLKRSFMRTVG